jgi:hypothetical protein
MRLLDLLGQAFLHRAVGRGTDLACEMDDATALRNRDVRVAARLGEPWCIPEFDGHGGAPLADDFAAPDKNIRRRLSSVPGAVVRHSLDANAPLLQGLAQEELDLAIHAAQLRACKPCNGVEKRGVEPEGE